MISAVEKSDECGNGWHWFFTSHLWEEPGDPAVSSELTVCDGSGMAVVVYFTDGHFSGVGRLEWGNDTDHFGY